MEFRRHGVEALHDAVVHAIQHLESLMVITAGMDVTGAHPLALVLVPGKDLGAQPVVGPPGLGALLLQLGGRRVQLAQLLERQVRVLTAPCLDDILRVLVQPVRRVRERVGRGDVSIPDIHYMLRLQVGEHPLDRVQIEAAAPGFRITRDVRAAVADENRALVISHRVSHLRRASQKCPVESVVGPWPGDAVPWSTLSAAAVVYSSAFW